MKPTARVRPSKSVGFPMIRAVRNRETPTKSDTPEAMLEGFTEMQVLALLGLDMRNVHAQFVFIALAEMCMPDLLYPGTLFEDELENVSFDFHPGDDRRLFDVSTPVRKAWTAEGQDLMLPMNIFDLGTGFARGVPGGFFPAFDKNRILHHQLLAWRFDDGDYKDFGFVVERNVQNRLHDFVAEFQQMARHSNTRATARCLRTETWELDMFLMRVVYFYADISCLLQYNVAQRFKVYKANEHGDPVEKQNHKNVLLSRAKGLRKINSLFHNALHKIDHTAGKWKLGFSYNLPKIKQTIYARTGMYQKCMNNIDTHLHIETIDGVPTCLLNVPGHSDEVLSDLTLIQPFDCSPGSSDWQYFRDEVHRHMDITPRLKGVIETLMRIRNQPGNFFDVRHELNQALFASDNATAQRNVDALWDVMRRRMNQDMHLAVHEKYVTLLTGDWHMGASGV